MRKCCQCKCCKAEKAPKPYVLRFVNVYFSSRKKQALCGPFFITRKGAVAIEASRPLGTGFVYLKTIQIKIPR